MLSGHVMYDVLMSVSILAIAMLGGAAIKAKQTNNLVLSFYFNCNFLAIFDAF